MGPLHSFDIFPTRGYLSTTAHALTLTSLTTARPHSYPPHRNHHCALRCVGYCFSPSLFSCTLSRLFLSPSHQPNTHTHTHTHSLSLFLACLPSFFLSPSLCHTHKTCAQHTITHTGVSVPLSALLLSLLYLSVCFL